MNYDEQLKELRQKVSRKKHLEKMLQELSAQRKKAASDLEVLVLDELRQLDMAKIRFCVEFTQQAPDASGIDSSYFEERFASAIEAAKNNNTELYCGEYGIIDVVSPEDTVKWYKAINQVLEAHNIPRAAWSYKEMDFGLSDARMDGVRDELLRYL